MYDEDHPTDRDRAPGAGASRRTVVRTAAGAAWAAPLIGVATAAPAAAAISTHRSLSVTSAVFFWKEWTVPALGLDHAWGVCPLITVHNASSSVDATGLSVTVTFPPGFVGTDGTLPSPKIINGPGDGWIVQSVNPQVGGGPSSVLFRRAAGLAASGSSTIGTWFPVQNPFSLTFKAQSTDQITVSATASAFTAGVGVLSEVAAPA